MRQNQRDLAVCGIWYKWKERKKDILSSFMNFESMKLWTLHSHRDGTQEKGRKLKKRNRTSKKTARKIASPQKMLQFQWLTVRKIHTPFPVPSLSCLGKLHTYQIHCDGCGFSSGTAESSWWHGKESRQWMTNIWRLSTGLLSSVNQSYFESG